MHLVGDLRKEFGDPALPVSVAVSGFNGFNGAEATRFPKSDVPWIDMAPADKIATQCSIDHGCRRLDIALSQLAAGNATRHPEAPHVVTSETRSFWRDAQYSPNEQQSYHYFHNAETCASVGAAGGVYLQRDTSAHGAHPSHTAPVQTTSSDERWRTGCSLPRGGERRRSDLHPVTVPGSGCTPRHPEKLEVAPGRYSSR